MKKLLVGCAVVTALALALLAAGWSGVLEQHGRRRERRRRGAGRRRRGRRVHAGPDDPQRGDRPQRLVDLDIADSYLDGVVLRASEPSFASSQHVPLDRSVSHSFDLPIPAGVRW